MNFENKYASIPALRDFLPDWRDEKAYNFVNMTPSLWAWQFMRRDPDYRNLWGIFLYDLIGDNYCKIASCITAQIEEKKFIGLKTSDDRLKEICSRAQTLAYLFKLECFPPSPREDYPEISFKQLPKKIQKIDITFNLYDSIEVSIAYLKRNIKEARNEFEIKDLRLRADKYKNYLRVLDAGFQYCKDDKEIAKVVYPKLSNSNSEGYFGSDVVRKNRDAAMRLMTGKLYRHIAEKN